MKQSLYARLLGAALLEAGADAYLTKGCPAADLIRTIRTTCGKK